MPVHIGSIPLLKQIQAERKGKPLADSAKSKIRMALLQGEQLANREVPARFGVSITALNDSIKDLERVGYRFGRDETMSEGAIWWIANKRHVPREDSGPTRTSRPRKKKGEVPTVAPVARSNGRTSSEEAVFNLDMDLKVARVEKTVDGVIRYAVRVPNVRGLWRIRVEGFEPE